MENFKIILEQTHKFKKTNLYVLVFCSDEGYGIDVSNKTSNFGRVNLVDKDKVMYVFELVNEIIIQTGDYLEACNALDYILSHKTWEELILVLHTHKRKIDKLEVYALVKLLELTKEERETVFKGCIIKVKKKNKLIGEFISLCQNEKFLFHFL